MVRVGKLVQNESGKGRAGCLIFALIVAAAFYFGGPVLTSYMDFVRIEDKMNEQARFAPSLTDDAIRRRILEEMDVLGLPNQARQTLVIRRSNSPREIEISARYSVVFELPFKTHVQQFNPSVREPL